MRNEKVMELVLVLMEPYNSKYGTKPPYGTEQHKISPELHGTYALRYHSNAHIYNFLRHFHPPKYFLSEVEEYRIAKYLFQDTN